MTGVFLFIPEVAPSFRNSALVGLCNGNDLSSDLSF